MNAAAAIRAETIDELNDLLDDLCDLECRNIFHRVSTINLIRLVQAIRKSTCGRELQKDGR